MNNKSSISASMFMRSIAKFSISSWTGFIFGILAVSITTRVFTPDIVGHLNMFNSMVDIFVSLTLVGMGAVVNRFFYELPAGWSLQQFFTRCLFITGMALMLSAILIMSGFFNELFYDLLQDNSMLIRLLFILNTLSVIVLTYFLSQFYRFSNDVYHFNIQQILIQFFSKLFVVIAALVRPTLDVVLTFNTIGIFMLMIVFVYLQRKQVFSWRNGGWLSREFRPLYRYAFFSWPNEIVSRFSGFILPYLVTTYLSATELGIYSSAGYFVAVFVVLQGGFRTYWAAFMYKYYRTERGKICKIHSYVAIFIIMLMVFAIIFQHVVYMLIGEAFHGSRLFFTLVLIPPILGLWEQTTSYGISLSQKNEQLMFISITSIALNVIGIYLCIEKWQLLGAAIGVCIAAVVRFLLITWRGQVYYKSIRNSRESILGLIILLGLAISNVVLNHDYCFELVIVLFFLMSMFAVYRQSLLEFYHLIRR